MPNYYTFFVLNIDIRVNGKLVALKVIRLLEEEGTPFTAIREGKVLMNEKNLKHIHSFPF